MIIYIISQFYTHILHSQTTIISRCKKHCSLRGATRARGLIHEKHPCSGEGAHHLVVLGLRLAEDPALHNGGGAQIAIGDRECTTTAASDEGRRGLRDNCLLLLLLLLQLLLGLLLLLGCDLVEALTLHQVESRVGGA